MVSQAKNWRDVYECGKRALMLVRQRSIGTPGYWASWFRCKTEDDENVFSIHGGGWTPNEAVKSLIDSHLQNFRVPFHGRTHREHYDNRLDLKTA